MPSSKIKMSVCGGYSLKILLDYKRLTSRDFWPIFKTLNIEVLNFNLQGRTTPEGRGG